MAHLVDCFECGAEVSSEADKCPKCSTPNGGHRCCICLKAEKMSNLYGYNGTGQLYHQKCLTIVIEESQSVEFDYKCPTCGLSFDKNIKYLKINDIPCNCKKCGYPIGSQLLQLRCKIENCDICGLPLITTAAEKVLRRSTINSDCWKERWLHKLCYEHMDNKYKSANSNRCFIATALYGEDSSKVRMLCFFRDEYLSASSLGRAFIVLYVRFSPPLARAIAKKSLLRTLVRYCIAAPALLFTENFFCVCWAQG